MRVSFCFQNVCRRVLCPVFHVKKGHICQPVNTALLNSIPKLATILFANSIKQTNVTILTKTLKKIFYL